MNKIITTEIAIISLRFITSLRDRTNGSDYKVNRTNLREILKIFQ